MDVIVMIRRAIPVQIKWIDLGFALGSSPPQVPQEFPFNSQDDFCFPPEGNHNLKDFESVSADIVCGFGFWIFHFHFHQADGKGCRFPNQLKISRRQKQSSSSGALLPSRQPMGQLCARCWTGGGGGFPLCTATYLTKMGESPFVGLN